MKESAKQKKHPQIDESYRQLGGEFYDEQTKSINPLRAWFHTSRHRLVGRCVMRNYKKGMKIADFGCGNCVWNTKGLNVTGIDINEEMMKHAKKMGRISEYCICDLNATPLKGNSMDIVVISETLEHIPDYMKTIAEVRRVLKKGGVVIATVPYDTNLSLWKPLFAVQCFIQGTVKGDPYYKKQCGHINHFSPSSIRKGFERAGFSVERQFDNKRFTIFTIARKPK